MPDTAYEKIADSKEASYYLSSPIGGGAIFIQLYESIKVVTREWTKEFEVGGKVNSNTIQTIYLNKSEGKIRFEVRSPYAY